MKRLALLATVVLLALACAACASRRDETWIGKNVCVCVDSCKEDVANMPPPDGR